MKKNMLSFRSKLELLTVVGVVIILLAGSGIFATNWVISPTSDNKSTFILCSNGNYYSDLTQANLQAAIWSLNNTGGEVVIPACNISLSSRLYLTDNVTLRGVNRNCSIISLAAGSDCDMVYIDSKTNVMIDSICFNMYNFSQTPNKNIQIIEVTGTASYPSSNITLQNCRFLNGCAGSMVLFSERSEHNRVLNCDFIKRENSTTAWGGGLFFRGNGNLADGNLFVDTYTSGIYCEHDSSTPQSAVSFNIITNNIITGDVCIGIAIEAWGSSSAPKAGNTIISNNMIYNQTLGNRCYGTQYPRGIAAQNNVTISNNIIYNTRVGIGLVTANAEPCTHNTVNNNVISKVTRGIYMEGINHSTISGNSVSNEVETATSYGIYLAYSFNNTMIGNTIECLDYGIRELNTYPCGGNIILGNDCWACTTPIDKDGATTIAEHNQGAVS